MRYLSLLLALGALVYSAPSFTHHSFAIYDIDNKISRTGILKKFEFSNPHIKIVLEVTLDDGSKETWVLESMNPRRWDSFDYPRDFVKVGEKVTLLGWPARNGRDEVAAHSMEHILRARRNDAQLAGRNYRDWRPSVKLSKHCDIFEYMRRYLPIAGIIEIVDFTRQQGNGVTTRHRAKSEFETKTII